MEVLVKEFPATPIHYVERLYSGGLYRAAPLPDTHVTQPQHIVVTYKYPADTLTGHPN